MNTSPDAENKIAPGPAFRPSLDLLIWGIIAIQVLVAIYGFIVLPDTVPIHWGLKGEVDGYGPKWVGTILYPLISIGVYVLITVLTNASPHLGGRESTAANLHVRKVILTGILLFLLIIQLTTMAQALNIHLDMSLVIALTISLLFLFLGNYMGKVRRNFWMGIRTPWTLANEVVWERTHRLGGWLFVAVGLIGIPFSFVPALRLWGIIVLLLAVCVFLTGYSYVCYQRVTQEQGEPHSPPFDGDN